MAEFFQILKASPLLGFVLSISHLIFPEGEGFSPVVQPRQPLISNVGALLGIHVGYPVGRRTWDVGEPSLTASACTCSAPSPD